MRAMRFTLAALLLAATAAPSQAAVVTFDRLIVDPLNPASGPRFEDGFTYQATVGSGWEIQGTYGNPASALVTFFNFQGSASGDTVTFAKTGGGAFTFVSVDTSTIGPASSDAVAISGYLGGNQVGSTLFLNTSSASPAAFSTVASTFSGAIDLLEVKVVAGNVVNNARLLDNFRFADVRNSTVPEPTSLALAGFAGIGMAVRALRRRRLQDQTAA